MKLIDNKGQAFFWGGLTVYGLQYWFHASPIVCIAALLMGQFALDRWAK